MWAGSAVRISTSSRPFGRRQAGGRLVEQDEARRAGERQRDLELALLAIGEFRHQPVLDRGQMHRLNEVLGGMDERVVAARAEATKAPARDAAAGEIDIVEHHRPGNSAEI